MSSRGDLQAGELCPGRVAERPEADAADGLHVVEEKVEAVSEVERDGAFRERFQHNMVTAASGTVDTVAEDYGSLASSLVSRVDAEEAEVPVRLGGDACDRRTDCAEEGVQRYQWDGVRQIVEACLGLGAFGGS